ncbi:hypothetical protein GCM10010954_21350 [Halobacillus andaensis]|uniref:Uncharacterized protein n=1 Tax=Halobacillus andaensis TaxID=1176239 RepID=A0A917B6L2_HALAA|nr:hypothetical protein [Halobacillus andaensis]MBP2004358.1 tryptophan-rich sensory protein [Halobacillus andaensis]GGF22245.1 hypothetical protein GCM10010954_21350 [Halobacillus andaensis]
MKNKIGILIVAATALVLYVIGALLNTDLFTPVTFRDGEFTISIIGIIVLFIISIIVGSVVTRQKK